MIKPLVSVVTPFYNTAQYLTECIESVLGQKYSDFEYILVDNCSTDGSSEIAEDYARRDSRVRLIQFSQFVSQLRNYNRALEQISQASEYCKIVEADNYIFPDCLELMVQAFQQSETIGLVSSYTLFGSELWKSGYPYPMPMISGREWARRQLRGAPCVFGSPTTVMFRSAVVRQHLPFFDESLLHSDTEKCMEILQNWDFGFVHQILSFIQRTMKGSPPPDRNSNRTRSMSISSRNDMRPHFWKRRKLMFFRTRSKRRYYQVLAEQALRLRGPAFWRYHEFGLKTLKQTLNWPYLVLQMVLVLMWMASNPGRTGIRLLRFCKRKMKGSR